MNTRELVRSPGHPAQATWWMAAVAGVLLSAVLSPTAGAAANPNLHRKHAAEVMDQRFNHGHAYPARGVVVHQLPSAALSVHYHDSPYYFHGGSWYRPYGRAGFRVIAPPVGVLVPSLPEFYTTVWFGRTPYYYANSVYYQWLPDQREYIVATPPDESAMSTEAPQGSTGGEPFIYPKDGQSEQQQATDRYECHRWAADESHFDPTQPANGAAGASDARGDYFRAMTACLEGRGYSVK